MRSYWVRCTDLPLGIQVDRLDQRNRTALHGCLWVLVVPLHAYLESSPPQSLELLSGYSQGGWSLPGKDAPNQHTSVLFIFPTALWVLWTLYQYNIAQFNNLFKVGLYGLAGLTPYLQLPISTLFFKQGSLHAGELIPDKKIVRH